MTVCEIIPVFTELIRFYAINARGRIRGGTFWQRMDVFALCLGRNNPGGKKIAGGESPSTVNHISLLLSKYIRIKWQRKIFNWNIIELLNMSPTVEKNKCD